MKVSKDAMGVACVVLAVLLASCNEPASVVDASTSNTPDAPAADAGSDAPAACNGVASEGAGACQCNADCANGGMCASEIDTGFPGGTCVLPCTPGNPTPAQTTCAMVSAGHLLVATCDATNRCRTGWACRISPTTHIGTCEPVCSTDADCPRTGHCNLYSGLCVPDATSGGGVAAVCTRDEQCQSGGCFPGSGTAPGFCAVSCNLMSPHCPESAYCQSISSDPAYTQGLCLALCTGGVGGTCPTGFNCGTHGQCLPAP